MTHYYDESEFADQPTAPSAQAGGYSEDDFADAPAPRVKLPKVGRPSGRILKIGAIVLVVGAIVAAAVYFFRPSKPGHEMMAEYAGLAAPDTGPNGQKTYPDYSARQLAVVKMTHDGYVTPDSDNFVTVEFTGKKGTKVSFEIMVHEVRWGTADDWYIFPVDGPHSLAVCKILGYELPTKLFQTEFRRMTFKNGGKVWFVAHPEIFDALGERSAAGQRDFSLKGLGRRQGPEDMESPRVIKTHSDLLRKLLAESNVPPDKPISGHVKEVIWDANQYLLKKLAVFPGCGGNKLSQYWENSPNFECALAAEVHPFQFFDYSHAVRCMKPKIKVGDKEMTMVEFYATKAYRDEFLLGILPLPVPAYVYPDALAKVMEEYGLKQEAPSKPKPGVGGKPKKKWKWL